MSGRFYEFLLRLSDETRMAYLMFSSVPNDILKNSRTISGKSVDPLLALCYVIDKYHKAETSNSNAIVFYESTISRLDTLLYGPQTIDIIPKHKLLTKQLSDILS